uniref:CCHC-type domain-containing protein n=1 Tax=Tanacetum cinerariifolium TaxID=118510 RepID=A0A6L2LSC7_TANCI|nr:hypothetical protein [Tanacetum cinerariifolium]
MTQKLEIGFGFTMKACFVCGNMSHLIKDCTFHEDRMAKKSVFPNNVGKGTGHRESRPVWNNVQRINHQNKFSPIAVFTRSRRILVSTAKSKAAASTSVAKPVNTARPKQSVNFSNSRISVVKGNGVTAIKASTGNKAYLANYQEINDGGFVAFGSIRDSLLPITLWAKAVNTACYILNRALVTKLHNKTPYELLNGRSPRLDFIRPFGCPVTILNTLDLLGKFKGNQTNKNAGLQDTIGNACTQDNVDAGKEVSDQHYIMLPLWSSISSTYKSSDDKAEDDKPKDISEKEASDVADSLSKEFEQGCMDKRGAAKAGRTNSFNTVSNPVNAASTSGTFSVGGPSSPHPDAFIPDDTLLHVDQDDSQIPNLEDTAELRSIGIFTSAYDDDLDTFTSLVQSVGAENDFNNMESSTGVSPIPTHRVHIDHPKDQILGDRQSAVQTRGWQRKVLEHMLLNKKDKRGIVVRNKARLVAQGNRQEERIDYDEVFAHVARIEAIRIFLAFTLYMGFIVYQMDVKGAFLYGTIEENVYVSQLPGFVDPQFPNKVYKVKQSKEGIFISQDKYVAEILKKFYFASVRTASTPIETQKPLVKYEEVADVDVPLYRSMIGSLMYLKDQPKLGLWYPRDSPFDLEAYSDSDYAGGNLDRKSTTGGCHFLSRRLISWQCKKQTVVATSTTEAKYVAAVNYYFLTLSSIQHALTQALKTKGIVDSGCSRHMTGNKAYLADHQEVNDGGFVAFGSSRGKITGKAFIDESNLWYKRLGHVNYKTMNKLVKGNLAEAVNIACYVLNRALVTKLHNKTPYELLNGRSPRLDFMRHFGSPVTILNTLNHLCKFKGKANEGFLVGYYVTSKAFRVFNTKTIKVKENLHVRFLENKPNVAEKGPNWLFDIDSLTNSMNYIPVSVGNQTNKTAGPQDTNGNADDKADDDKPKDDTGSKILASDAADSLSKEFEQGSMDQRGAAKAGSTNSFNTVSNPVNAASTSGTFSTSGPSSSHPDVFIPDDTLLDVDQDDSQIPDLEDTVKLRSTGIFTSAYDDDLDIFTSPVQSVRAKADFNNKESSTVVSHIPTHMVHIDHPKDQILGDPQSAIQTKGWQRNVLEHMLLIEAIRIFLASASYIGFIVYQIDRKSAFLYGRIEEEVQDKYVAEILKKFDFSSVRTASTPIEAQKPLVKDEEAADVDVSLYRSMIRSLMYLTAFRPDIMFAVCACSRFQVTLKLSHLHAVKRIFSQISAKVKTGLGYDSQFNEKEVLDVKEEEVTDSVFDNRSSDEENSLANDRIKKGEGFHAVSPPLTENYMPPKPNLSFAGLDYFIYKFKISETVTSLSKDVKDAPETSIAFGYPQQALKSTGVVDSGCSRMKWIKREYRNARTLQQNRVAERKNKTLIEAARTMLADSLLPISIWAEAVNTACYVLNMVLMTKLHNKTPYKLLNGRSPRLDFMRPFGCPVTILNTLDPLGKFKGKADEGFLVGVHKILMAMQALKIMLMQERKCLIKTTLCCHCGILSLPLTRAQMTRLKMISLRMILFKQGCMDQRGAAKASSTNSFNTVSNPVNAASTSGTFSAGGPSSPLPDAFIPDDTLLDVDQDDSQIRNLEDTVELRKADFNNMESFTFISPIPTHRVHIDHPKDQILGDPHSAVQTRGMAKKSSGAHALKVWRLVDLPYGKKAIGTKWVYKNKKDERGIVVRNKARLVEQGHKLEEGIDYDEMDVKSAFLYGTVKEEVYVSQPPGFIDLQFQNKVYIYDIIFGSTKKSLYDKFETLMHKRFQMSSMGELTFFLGLQMDVKSAFLYGTVEEEVYVSQPPGFIDLQFQNKVYKVEKTLYGLHQAPRACQDKYVAEILKKFDFAFVRIVSTPIETQKPLVKDKEATDVDVPLYRSMIGPLMYLIASRPDIMFTVWACSRFHVTPKLSHLHVVKRIFRKSTTEGCLFLCRRLISWQCKKQTIVATSTTEAEYVAATNQCGQFWNTANSQTINDEKQIHATVDGKTVIFENLPLLGYEGEGDSFVRAVTTASLDVQLDSSNIAKTQSKVTLNMHNPHGEGSGSGPGRQETMGGAMAQIRFEGAPIQSSDPPFSTGNTVESWEDRMEHAIELTDLVPQTPYDSPLSRGHTPGSDEGSMTLNELTDLCITLSQNILDLEKVKTAQPKVIASLKNRVTKLEQRQSSRILGFHPFRAGSTAETVSAARPDISAATPKVSTAAPKTPPTTTTLFDDEDVTLVDTLVKMKSQKAKEKRSKGILQEPEPMKKTKKKDQDQIERDARVALKIQAYLDEEAKTERERQEEASKAALAELYDEVQEQIDVDHELAARLTHKEQEMYTIEERSKLFTHAQLKSKSFKEIQKLYTKEQKWIDAFVPIGFEKIKRELEVERKEQQVVPDDDKAIDYETLDVKSLIVNCESHVLGTMETGDVRVYKLTRLDGSYRHFSTFSRMLKVLDRQDVLDLHKIVIKRFPAKDPEGYDLIL